MGSELAAVVFGLASAITWGGGDFCGGLATRRSSVVRALLLTQSSGLVLLLALALITGEQLPGWQSVAWSLAAGMAGTLGLSALYQALSVGSAAVVAPISAVLAASIPAAVAMLLAGLPEAPQLAGFGVALAGVWLVTQEGRTDDSQQHNRRGVWLALAAGIGFGCFFVLINRASVSATFWPLAVARAVSLVAIAPLALLRATTRPAPGALLPALLAGALDVGGNAFFVLAGRLGRLDVAAVLSSLYPASTVLLSLLLLGQNTTRTQQLGLLIILAAIVLIAS